MYTKIKFVVEGAIKEAYDPREVSLEKRRINRIIPSYNGIRYLNVSGNNLKWLPEFPLIEVLICRDNKLTELPVLLDNLLDLDCSKNPLTTLPTMRNIRCINISHTLIAEIENYPKLKELIAVETKLQEVRILSLEKLDCTNSPITVVFDLPHAYLSSLIKKDKYYEKISISKQIINSNPIIDWRYKKYNDTLEKIFEILEIGYLFH